MGSKIYCNSLYPGSKHLELLKFLHLPELLSLVRQNFQVPRWVHGRLQKEQPFHSLQCCLSPWISALWKPGRIWAKIYKRAAGDFKTGNECWPVWLSWLEHHSHNQKVAGLIPDHWSRTRHYEPGPFQAYTGGNQSMILSHINVSLSPFLSLWKQWKKNVLGWGLKKRPEITGEIKRNCINRARRKGKGYVEKRKVMKREQ